MGWLLARETHTHTQKKYKQTPTNPAPPFPPFCARTGHRAKAGGEGPRGERAALRRRLPAAGRGRAGTYVGTWVGVVFFRFVCLFVCWLGRRDAMLMERATNSSSMIASTHPLNPPPNNNQPGVGRRLRGPCGRLHPPHLRRDQGRPRRAPVPPALGPLRYIYFILSGIYILYIINIYCFIY